MKAKEYFTKYNEAIWNEAREEEFSTSGPTAKMFIEFMTEMKDIINSRNIKTDRGLIGVVQDQNNKWNSVYNMFIKKYGLSPIKYNGFKLGFDAEINGEKERVENT